MLKGALSAAGQARKRAILASLQAETRRSAYRRQRRRRAGLACAAVVGAIGAGAVWRSASTPRPHGPPAAPIVPAAPIASGPPQDAAGAPLALARREPSPTAFEALRLIQVDRRSRPTQINIISASASASTSTSARESVGWITRAPAGASRIERLDDDALLQLLSDLGRPTGLIRIGEKVILTDAVVDASPPAPEPTPTSPASAPLGLPNPAGAAM